MEGSPRLAATQASKSLASSSRTWFSTGINKTGLFINMPPVDFLEHVHFANHLPKDPALCKQIWAKHSREDTKVF
jgi:hypothetical protein